ncbi:Centromere/kinetochore Zw10-domain-containing protein [Glomus cerebriforme]|uniref:Centromere/kinetochore Zw10-domain-containing protein n=1 Tax=Glomus cerebriforme TaxID=658196 RepID=A0A397SZ32_9GLOM|nr:Centromere/kinetochore Zw10-domain-containing protein [Glomus cerebriforme]
MPPLPVSAVALPGAFISTILEGDRKNDFTDPVEDQQNMLLATSSADREAAFSCIQQIDFRIRSVKTEILQIILDRHDAFVKLYNNSISLRDKIDTLFMEVDVVSRGINHSETGMKPKLINALQENRTIMQEVQNTKSVVETLEYLSEIQNCVKRFQEYLMQGRIEEASGSITYMDSLLESPPIPTERKIQIFDKLKTQLSNMKESLDQTLDDLLTQSISFKKIGDNEGFSLTVLSSVEGANATALLTSVFISLNEVDSINMQLSRLKKNVMKYLIIPLLKHRESWNASIEVDDNVTARLIIGPNLNVKNINQDGIFTPLITIFKFMYTFIFGGLDHSSKELIILPLATQYASTFGKFISHDLRDVVISEYLSHVIPTETFEFKKFDEVAHDVKEFQAEMRKMGFMRQPRDGEEEEESTLGAYVAKVDVLFTIKKRDKLLELGRNIMLEGNFESEEITEEQKSEQNFNEQKAIGESVVESSITGEINKQKEDIFAIQNNNDIPNEGWEVDWNEGWDEDGWDESENKNESLINKNIESKQVILEKKLVRYSISNKAKPLIDLIIKTLNEARNLNAKSGVRLYQATLDFFDLYRAIMPVFHYNTFSNVPALAMLFRNDCLWLADQLLIVQEQFIDSLSSSSDSENTEDMKGKISYFETVEKLRELGKEWYDIQIDKQKSVLKEILDEMDGVQQIANDDRFEACQNAMNQIVYTMNHLSKIWRDVLRPTEYYTVLGVLIDSVLACMIDYVEDLYDISAEDSQQLNLICTMLFQLENLFNKKEVNSVEKYIKNWTKFLHMTDILELTQAEIMKRFRNGELVCFTTDELEGLICALFADTQIRENTLSEIREGHPVVTGEKLMIPGNRREE